MLHEEGGKNFRAATGRRFESRGGNARDPFRILIVDPVVGSRFALANVVAQPGVLAETAASPEDARARMARGGVALVLVDEDLGKGCRGIEFLVEMRERHPDVRRALVLAERGGAIARVDLERAAPSFVLARPWNAAFLRHAIRDSLGGSLEFASWEHRSPVARRRPVPLATGPEGDAPDRRIDLLARGLLAGLNSCESEAEVFELLHAELAATFGALRWLWLDEESGSASSIVGDWPLETGLRIDALGRDEHRLLEDARRSSRITRLGGAPQAGRGDVEAPACIGFALKDGHRRLSTILVWVTPGRCTGLSTLLREIQSGLRRAVRRIREAEARALAARRLARRVSEELRTPVGALSHAIDRLRGEALRAGLSTEWVDRVSSESARLVRVVELFEDEIVSDRQDRSVVAN
ncbi:MAG: hypothetical protein R3F35_00340 [Myxococcota bacterium]